MTASADSTHSHTDRGRYAPADWWYTPPTDAVFTAGPTGHGRSTWTADTHISVLGHATATELAHRWALRELRSQRRYIRFLWAAIVALGAAGVLADRGVNVDPTAPAGAAIALAVVAAAGVLTIAERRDRA
jgi:hypothetical protein